MANRIKLAVQKIGFRNILIVLLLGCAFGQYMNGIQLVDGHNKSIKRLCISRSNELNFLTKKHGEDTRKHEEVIRKYKQVISKFSDDIRENVKVLYEAQVNTSTSYSNRVCETDSTPNITASNEYVTDFTVAVSWDLKKAGWTFGKVVYIEELGEFAKIADLMNKRFCKRIDVFNADTKEAIKFGKRTITAYLLDDVKLARKPYNK